MLNFNTDVKYLKGVGEKRAQILNRLGIDTVGALLRYYPRGYVDFSVITDIFDLNPDQKACVKAEIITPITEHKIRKSMTLYKFRISDGTGVMSVTLFNEKYTAAKLHQGSTYLFSGKVTGFAARAEFSSPDILEENDNTIHPIYKANASLSSKSLQKLIKTALSCTDLSCDVLSEKVLTENKLVPFNEAIVNIHFPKSDTALESAKRRLVFEELFVLRTCLMLMKGKRRHDGIKLLRDCTNDFLKLLPFDLTAAQKRVTAECMTDMLGGKCMNRLIEGDVGSGKTAVAAALMFNTAKCGLQSALMAPTEILAEQHFAFLSSVLKESGLKIALLSGGTKQGEKKKIKAALKNGEIDIVVGTHALLTSDTEFKNLALVITDEQHRFGVAQRAALAEKGKAAHTLVMSATPIPRTMGLIIYGDLDISVIDEYPKGRQKIDTYFVESGLRDRVYNYIKKYLDEGRQGYIVCPMVEENEETALCSAEQYYQNISAGEFKDYRVGLLHGKMKSQEKDAVMRWFKAHEIDLLVCTTVIEVGIDVPNAAIMVIENAERFGLSALHQLRGRIGRGGYKSSCILISDAKGQSADRLNVIKNNQDGFVIADADLKLRGPGDFLGNRQHGLPELKIADLYSDRDILALASMAAANVLEQDAKLIKSENTALRAEVISMYKRFNEN